MIRESVKQEILHSCKVINTDLDEHFDKPSYRKIGAV